MGLFRRKNRGSSTGPDISPGMRALADRVDRNESHIGRLESEVDMLRGSLKLAAAAAGNPEVTDDWEQTAPIPRLRAI